MLFVLSALATSPDPTPRGIHLRSFELRATHGVVQRAAKTPPGEEDWGWAANLGVVASRLAGPAWVQFEVSLHGAVARRPWGAAEVRFEPRIGVRFQPLLDRPGPFVGVAGGVAADSGGATPTVVGTLGWTGPGQNLRPVFAVDGRFGVPTSFNEYQLRCLDCPVGPALVPGGTGVLASVGLQWVSIRGAVR